MIHSLLSSFLCTIQYNTIHKGDCFVVHNLFRFYLFPLFIIELMRNSWPNSTEPSNQIRSLVYQLIQDSETYRIALRFEIYIRFKVGSLIFLANSLIINTDLLLFKLIPIALDSNYNLRIGKNSSHFQ